MKNSGNEAQVAADFKALRALCDESTPLGERRKLLQPLTQHVFVELEHQVVFESIRALLSVGPISISRLNVHLNNRGFPDTDVEKYFGPAASE